MSSSVGKKDGTCYALTRIKSPKNQEVYLMFGLNGMWGHSGGYRSARASNMAVGILAEEMYG